MHLSTSKAACVHRQPQIIHHSGFHILWVFHHYFNFVGSFHPVEIALRLAKGHVNARFVYVIAARSKDIDNLIGLDSRACPERSFQPIRRDQFYFISNGRIEIPRNA